MTVNLMDLPHMRDAASALDALLNALPDDEARAICASSFIVAGAMALRFYASGPVAINHLNTLAGVVAECDAEDKEGFLQ